MKTITQSEIQNLLKQGFNVRTQSNGLAFVGKNIETQAMMMQGVKHGVGREEAYRLVSEKRQGTA